MTVKCTNRSFVPPSGVMKPYPFSLLNPSRFRSPCSYHLLQTTTDPNGFCDAHAGSHRLSASTAIKCGVSLDSTIRVQRIEAGPKFVLTIQKSEENENLCGRPCPYMPCC